MKNKKRKDNLDEDDLMPVAFDLNEHLPLPENYVLDDIHGESINFLKQVEKERLEIELRHKRMHQEIIIEFNSKSRGKKSHMESYKQLRITEDYIKCVIEEYKEMKRNLTLFKQESCDSISDQFKTVNEIVNKLKFHKENVKNIPEPSNTLIKNLILKLNNSMCLKLVKNLHKILEHAIYTHQDYQNVVLWIYVFLIPIETPLVDDDNSILYSLNKMLHSQINKNDEDSKETISLKILYVIISEIFKQRIINY